MNENKDVIKACEVAAKWWADQLGTAKQDNGAGNGLANLLMAIVSIKNSPNNETREKFYESLKLALIEELKKDDRVYLYTDYGPCGLLETVSRGFEISGYAFPCKTEMYVSADKVTVSEGYRAPEKVLYVKENTVTDNTENKI